MIGELVMYILKLVYQQLENTIGKVSHHNNSRNYILK